MTLRQYLIIMSLATVLCWIAWVLVVINIDPFTADAIGFGFFYVSLFFAFLGTISLFAFIIYHFFSRVDQPMFRYVQKSFRQAIVLAAVLIIILFLQANRFLNFWTLALLVGLLILLVSFWFSNRGVGNSRDMPESGGA